MLQEILRGTKKYTGWLSRNTPTYVQFVHAYQQAYVQLCIHKLCIDMPYRGKGQSWLCECGQLKRFFCVRMTVS